MIKPFFCALLLFTGACAQQHVITRVNQLPLYAPSQLSYAARNGTLPLEIHGALPADINREDLAANLHLPGDFAPAKLVLFAPVSAQDAAPGGNPLGSLCLQRLLDSGITRNGNDCHGPGRMVLVFNPDMQTLPDWACEAAQKIATAPGQDVRVLAAFCIGKRLASSGQVQIPARNGSSVNVTSAINVLLIDMLHPRPGSAREGNHASR